MVHLLRLRRWSRWGGFGLLAIVALGGALAFGLIGRSQAAVSKTRHYYIAADEVDWDYAPSGINKITGQPFDDEANVFVQRGEGRIGRVYRKALYHEYTDATFTKLKPIADAWKHLGALGPAIHAEVGDTILVDFKNNTRFPVSMHPHGVLYQKDSEGAPYADGTSGNDKADDGVPPGTTHAYTWQVPDRAGPGPGDGSSVLWMYHSHTDEVKDSYSGLIGPLIITARGQAKPDGSPKDIDREFVTMFEVSDENNSWYLDENIERYTDQPEPVDRDDEEFHESNLMHAINGYVFGNLPGLDMRVGERVRWYVIGMGTEVDLHTPHWHGQTLLMSGGNMGMRTDMVELMPGSMKILDMTPDNPGTWLFHCHVNDHISAGMLALFNVAPAAKAQAVDRTSFEPAVANTSSLWQLYCRMIGRPAA
jgi:FtsP/CotA-like multicopper oxidase with cupredoxin domain